MAHSCTAHGPSPNQDSQSLPGRRNAIQGLGIFNKRGRDRKGDAGSTDWTPIPLEHRPPSKQIPYTSTTPLMTPLSGSTQCGEAYNDIDTSYNDLDKNIKRQASSLFTTTSCLASLHSISEKKLCASPGQFSPGSPGTHTCHGSSKLRKSMWSWPGSGIIFLSLLATTLSGLFFFVGVTGPAYGAKVGTHGMLKVSSAATLTTVLSKLIESMSAVLVAVLVGQVLARKAYASDKHRGVNLAQILMRGWATQPGTIFSHWSSVRYAALSKLGFVALLAAIMVLLYTSAATALVQPQLKYAKTEYRLLRSQVKSSFANAYYVQQTCKSPITHFIEHHEDEIGKSCIQIEHASQAYHNYQSWLSSWTGTALIGNGTKSLETRPPGWALLKDNTTITAPWIDTNVTDKAYWLEKTGWFVNNITMAMPHPGVVTAAIDSSNSIIQPEQLDGLGTYTVRAAVPAPFVNVLCVMGMSEADLRPVINNTARSMDGTGTALDDIFHWGPRWGTQKWPPSFSIIPIEHNSVLNDTAEIPYGRDAIYVLGKGGDVDQAGAATTSNYALCSISVGQTPDCSTEYTASSSGGTLAAICDDHDELRYSNSEPTAPSGNATLSKDWVNIGAEWARAVSLNDGEFEGNSSNVRVWTQLFLSNTSLDSHGKPALSIAMPSPAEALAVLSGCTLLSSTKDTPFIQFWNYSSPILMDPGQTQYFNASIRAQQYASGGTAAYEKGFIVVLLLTFVLNAYILLYLILHRHWYLDFGDPVNLFPLAVNSPPNRQSVESSCLSASEEAQFRQFWKLKRTGDGHLYLEIPEDFEREPGSPTSSRKTAVARAFATATRPLSTMFERVRRD